MPNRSRYALLWCFVQVLLLLTIFTQLNIVTIHFLMVPAVMLAMRLEWRGFALSFAICLFALFALLGGLAPIVIAPALFFLPPAVLLAWSYRKQKTAKFALTAGTLLLLGEQLLVLLLIYAAGINPILQFQDAMRQGLEPWKTYLSADIAQDAVRYVTQMVPFFMVAFAAYYMLVTHAVSRRLLRVSGIHVPGLPPMREWRLPKALGWYLLAVFALDLFVDAKSDAMIVMVVWNVLPLLTIAFSVQAIGFLFHVVHVKRWNRALPFIAIALMIVIPPTMYAFCLLGLMDVMLGIRSRFTKER